MRVRIHIPCNHHCDGLKTQMVGNYNDCQVEPNGGSQTGKKINKVICKRKTLGPTDGITNYIAGWKLTLEPYDNALLVQSAALNH